MTRVAEFHNSLAVALERLGRTGEASKAYLQAIRLDPIPANAEERTDNVIPE